MTVCGKFHCAENTAHVYVVEGNAKNCSKITNVHNIVWKCILLTSNWFKPNTHRHLDVIRFIEQWLNTWNHLGLLRSQLIFPGRTLTAMVLVNLTKFINNHISEIVILIVKCRLTLKFPIYSLKYDMSTSVIHTYKIIMFPIHSLKYDMSTSVIHM